MFQITRKEASNYLINYISCKSGFKILKNFIWCSARFNFRSSTVFDLCPWYEQAVKCDLYLYADDSCLFFQRKNVTEIKKQWTKDFNNICDWFVDNKLSIHFGEDKMKSILFSSKRNLKLVEELDIRYKDIKIKQYKHVNYLGCMLDDINVGWNNGS